jgi:hypothetical protein
VFDDHTWPQIIGIHERNPLMEWDGR